MIPQQKLDELVTRLRDSAGKNLLSVILYGSAAAGDFVARHSDLNVLCILFNSSLGALQAVRPSVEWWTRQRHRPPLFLTLEELQRGADVFSIEFLDMQQTHKLLWGEDSLVALRIPMHAHRAQVEYELREKAIVLRQRLLPVLNKPEETWDLVLGSLSAFGTLFRHALLALGEQPAPSKREGIERLTAKLNIETSSILALLDIRDGKRDRKSANLNDLLGSYLTCINQVTAAVDRMLDSPSTSMETD